MKIFFPEFYILDAYTFISSQVDVQILPDSLILANSVISFIY